ncbi:MAG: isoprenylcysteine carboxylmethyltransferase family protein [Candidatus Omnitrophica bacterium]|nr:isoprenylcysteine carboxylmethyltransferase family protein [Candidatus Omnitrophota bacterium]
MNKKIMPPTYFIVLLFSSIGLHFLSPVIRLISLPYNYLGILIIIFGIILNLWTDSLFKKRQTTVKPHEMPNFFISSGPFRISRHPMYLGMTLILLGVAVFLGSLISFVFPIIFVMIMEKLFIPMEEKNLEKEFGDKYIAYKKRVRRWI